MSNRTIRRVAALAFIALAGVAGGPAFAAKTLVYCSEGSPEGFNPQFFTTGTTLDASSVPIYNRLVEFELGTTNIVPGLAESWTAAADGLSYTFKLKNGRSLQLDFNVDNLFDRREPIYGNAGGTIGTNATSLRPRTGDVSSLARVTVPTNFSYLVPRNYSFSAKFIF